MIFLFYCYLEEIMVIPLKDYKMFKNRTPSYLGGRVGNCVFYLYFLLLYIIKIGLLSFGYEKGIE
jgi:hypothetical protein